MESAYATPAFPMLAWYLIIIIQWSAGCKLRQAATQKRTIIAIIGKLSTIIVCALAIDVPSELDLSIQVVLGTQLAMPHT